MFSQAPPSNRNAEIEFLSNLMINGTGEYFCKGITEITSNMFYHADCKIVFQAIVNLYNQNALIDVVTLAAELERLKLYEQIGGLTFLTEILSNSYTDANIKVYADLIKDCYYRREIISYNQKVIQMAYDNSISLEIIKSSLTALPSLEQKQKDKTTAELLQSSVQRIQERLEEPEKNRIGLLTGLKNLDKEIGGLRKRDIIFLTAEPNVGKSILAHQICLLQALKGKQAVYFNFEMGEEYIGDRTLAMSLPLETRKIQNPAAFFTKEDKELINTTDIDKQLENTLHIFTNIVPTVINIMTECKKLNLKGHKPDIIAIDYLQMMTGPGKNQMEIVEGISKQLKNIAKEFDCPVIVISSTSHGGEMRHSKQLKYDGDVIINLVQDKNSQITEKYKLVICEVQKNRNGRTGGQIEMILSLDYLKFREVDNGVQNRY